MRACAFVFQVNQLGAFDLAQQGLVVTQAHAQVRCDLALERAATQPVLQTAQRLLADAGITGVGVQRRSAPPTRPVSVLR